MATKTLNIALDAELLRDVDALVREEKASRSEYFRRLALADLARRRTLTTLFDVGNRKGRRLGFKSEKSVYRALRIP